MKQSLMTGLMAGMLLVAVGISATPIAAYAGAPPRTMKQDEEAHPGLVKGIHAVRDARDELEHDSNDYGGHKKKAIEDLDKSLHSLKKALYFRLKMDDKAIDAANP